MQRHLLSKTLNHSIRHHSGVIHRETPRTIVQRLIRGENIPLKTLTQIQPVLPELRAQLEAEKLDLLQKRDNLINTLENFHVRAQVLEMEYLEDEIQLGEVEMQYQDVKEVLGWLESPDLKRSERHDLRSDSESEFEI